MFACVHSERRLNASVFKSMHIGVGKCRLERNTIETSCLLILLYVFVFVFVFVYEYV